MRGVDIAIVGLGALFPGAGDVSAFWRNITGGVDAIGTIPPERWDPDLYYQPAAPAAGDRFYCRRGGFLDELATFDAAGFGIMPSTVDVAEPDQLLALRVAAEAIADAGGEQVLPDRARVGVVVGRGGYLTSGCARLDQRVQVDQLVAVVRDLIPGVDRHQLRTALRERLGPEQPEASIGLVPNLAASRIANRFDLHGPAYTVDAACASGLLAVEHAVRELAEGRCDAMVAGAVHVSHHPTLWSVFTQLKALSPKEQIRPFDRHADGTLLSEGVGMVVLKRAADALANGDRIYAVIRGTGTASDGRATSMMTPNPEGQLLAVRRAWHEAGLTPGAGLGLVEAHGTATPAGDAAELTTMINAFGAAGAPIGIGTVKSMIGHAMPAAGMAGLIKAALAVHHATLPPTLHIDEPHPALAGTRFEPVLSARPWETSANTVRRAVVNAFGFGGINAHVVLEAVDAGSPSPPEPSVPVLLLAADTPGGLERELLADDHELMARAARRLPAADRPCRLAIWAPDGKKLKQARQIVARARKWGGRHGIWFAPRPLLTGPGQIALLFPGFEQRGTADLAGEESVVDHAIALLRAGRAQAARLRAAGIVPGALAGHSMGEWTAMVVAGIYPTVDEFVESLRPGMVTVADVVYAALGCSADTARQALADDDQIVVSHDNCPHQSVICGPVEQLEPVVDTLRSRGVLVQVMPFRTGFHTPALAPYLESARTTVDRLAIRPPSVPVWSATSLAPMPSEPGEIRDLVLRHLVEPVRFRQLTERLHDSGIRAFVQVGSGSLTGFVEDTLGDREHLTVTGDSADRTAAALWAFGLNRGGKGKRLSLGVPRIRLEPIAVHQPVPLTTTSPDTTASPDTTGSPVGAAWNAVLAETTAAARQVAEALSTPRVADEIEFTREFSLRTMPELADHAIFPQPDGWLELSDGFPTVPITGLVEVIADAARASAPNFVVSAVESVRAMRWLAVEPAVQARITARREGDRVRVRVGDYAEGVVRLAAEYPKPQEQVMPRLHRPRPAPVQAAELYSDGWMFHGPRFAGVTTVETLADNGITGTLTVLPAPGALLDNAGQLIGHWMQVSRDVDQTVLPTGVDAVRYFGPAPATGQRIQCTAWILDVTPEQMRADAELRTTDGRLWCRIEGWTTRRFTTDDRIWQVKLRPDRHTLAEPHPGGWVLVTEKWADSATRELMMRRYLTASERDCYLGLDLRTQRQWLVGRVAVKDAVRRWLWNRGAGPIFPAELTVTDDGAGVRVRGAFVTPAVSVAHCVDPAKPSAGGCAVAIASDSKVPIGIRPGPPGGTGGTVVTDGGTSYVVDFGPVDLNPAGGDHVRG
jgi:acyl transferase domain-containing protein